jgi:hypothetical protein
MYDNAAGRDPMLDLLTLLARLRAAGTVERPAPVWVCNTRSRFR